MSNTQIIRRVRQRKAYNAYLNLDTVQEDAFKLHEHDDNELIQKLENLAQGIKTEESRSDGTSDDDDDEEDEDSSNSSNYSRSSTKSKKGKKGGPDA